MSSKAIEVIPAGWWGIVLVGMHLPAEHPAIQRKAHKKDVPDNWRGQRVGKGKMPAGAFDNAIRAGQREAVEARPPHVPGLTLRQWESRCRIEVRHREAQLACWMASFEEVPLLVRPTLFEWTRDRELILDLRVLGVEPECWEFDGDNMDRVPAPAPLKAAA